MLPYREYSIGVFAVGFLADAAKIRPLSHTLYFLCVLQVNIRLHSQKSRWWQGVDPNHTTVKFVVIRV